jgi:hypothetical protein
VAKVVWEAIGQTVAPTDQQVAAYAEKSWLLFCTVMNDKFKSHLRYSETVQFALELACACWPIWQQVGRDIWKKKGFACLFQND